MKDHQRVKVNDAWELDGARIIHLARVLQSLRHILHSLSLQERLNT